MKKLFVYNTLSRKKEEFKPIKEGVVGLYTCGPTVYDYAHIGNLRTYLFEDFLQRTLEYDGYQVKRIMNITDVGHLTGDMDMGEDKLERKASKEGGDAWKIAAFFTDAFKNDLKSLRIEEPSRWCRVTDHIPQQIALIKTLEDKGFTYRTSDGIYFDTALFPDYIKLSHLPLAELQEGARVEINEEKRNPTDFALWKFSPKDKKRQMEWQSPWGLGFPGWHIECSAISLEYLSDNLDIHCGGVDHINIHHTNEIAQSEVATGRKFFNYWLHSAFLNIRGGKKMAKSSGDFLTLKKAFVDKGYNPLVYRFAALQVHYRKPMEFSEETAEQANSGLESFYQQVAALGNYCGNISSSWQERFSQEINDDLNMPRALAVAMSLLKSDLSPADKLATIADFDRVFGLDIMDEAAKRADLKLSDLPEALQSLVQRRLTARINKDWQSADKLRQLLEDNNYLMEDVKDGYRLRRKK